MPPRAPSSFPWGELPPELQQHVANLLDVRTRLALRCANRAANELAIVSLPTADIMCVGNDPERDASVKSLLRHPTCKLESFTIRAGAWHHIARSTRVVAKRGRLVELRATQAVPANQTRESMPCPRDVFAMVNKLADTVGGLQHLGLDFNGATLPYSARHTVFDLGVLARLHDLRTLSFKGDDAQRLRISLPPLPVSTLELGDVDVEAPWPAMMSLQRLAMHGVSFERRAFAVPPLVTTVAFRNMEPRIYYDNADGRAVRNGTGWGLSGRGWHRHPLTDSDWPVFDIPWLAPIYPNVVTVATDAYMMSNIARLHTPAMARVMPRLTTATFVCTQRQSCIDYRAVDALEKAGIRPVLARGTLEDEWTSDDDDDIIGMPRIA